MAPPQRISHWSPANGTLSSPSRNPSLKIVEKPSGHLQNLLRQSPPEAGTVIPSFDLTFLGVDHSVLYSRFSWIAPFCCNGQSTLNSGTTVLHFALKVSKKSYMSRIPTLRLLNKSFHQLYSFKSKAFLGKTASVERERLTQHLTVWQLWLLWRFYSRGQTRAPSSENFCNLEKRV